jgi:hypothetical protein
MEPRPFIYLDQWAFSTISTQAPLRDRLLNVLSRGTLLISILNFMEIARAKGATAASIAAFLDTVGGRWAAITTTPGTVVSREKEHRLDAWRDEVNLPVLLRAPGVQWKPANLARRLQESRAVQTLAECEKAAAGIAADFEVARKRVRAGDLKLDGFWDIPSEVGTHAVFATVLQRLVRGSLNLERHQIDDLLHTCIPVTYCDVAFLDRKTKTLLEGMETRAKVFYAGELEEALADLEGRWPPFAMEGLPP